MVFLKRPAFALLFCAVLASGSATAQRRGEYALRAAATLDSLYACYSVPGTKLLRENYPDDASYKATYLAGESAGESVFLPVAFFRDVVGCRRAGRDRGLGGVRTSARHGGAARTAGICRRPPPAFRLCLLYRFGSGFGPILRRQHLARHRLHRPLRRYPAAAFPRRGGAHLAFHRQRNRRPARRRHLLVRAEKRVEKHLFQCAGGCLCAETLSGDGPRSTTSNRAARFTSGRAGSSSTPPTTSISTTFR